MVEDFPVCLYTRMRVAHSCAYGSCLLNDGNVFRVSETYSPAVRETGLRGTSSCRLNTLRQSPRVNISHLLALVYFCHRNGRKRAGGLYYGRLLHPLSAGRLY